MQTSQLLLFSVSCIRYQLLYQAKANSSTPHFHRAASNELYTLLSYVSLYLSGHVSIGIRIAPAVNDVVIVQMLNKSSTSLLLPSNMFAQWGWWKGFVCDARKLSGHQCCFARCLPAIMMVCFAITFITRMLNNAALR